MSIKKNLAFNITLTISNMIFPIISFPYAARILGPEGTGEVNFAQSFCQYFIIVAALGIPTYGVREIAKLKNRKAEQTLFFYEINIIRIITSLLVLIPYLFIVFNIEKFESNINLYLWGAFLIISNVTAIEWFFIGLEDFRYITIRSIIIKGLLILLLFGFVKERDDVIPYFLINVTGVLLSGFFNIKHAIKHLQFRSLKFSSLQLRKHMRPLVLIFGGIIAITVYTLVDTVLLGMLVSNESVGLYTAANKITKISLSIITSLSIVLVPRLSFAVSDDNQLEIKRLLTLSFNFVSSFSIPISVGIFALAPELIYLFSGLEFEPAINTLRILSPLIFIIGVASILSNQILSSFSKDSLVMKSAIVGSVVSVVLNLILIPRFHENGSAISNLIAEIFVTIVVFIYARKHVCLKIPVKQILLNSCICIPFFVVVYLFRYFYSSHFLIIFGSIFTCAFYYIAVQLSIKNILFISLYHKCLKFMAFKA